MSSWVASEGAASQAVRHEVGARGGGGGDVVGEILAQLPPDLRQDFQRQIDAGVPSADDGWDKVLQALVVRLICQFKTGRRNGYAVLCRSTILLVYSRKMSKSLQTKWPLGN